MNQAETIYLLGAFILIMSSPSLQIFIKDSSDETRWQQYQSQSFTSNIKRHSEGTFSSDLTKYLDKMKAKDFVQWLMNKRNSLCKRFVTDGLKKTKFQPIIAFFRFIQMEKRRPQL